MKSVFMILTKIVVVELVGEITYRLIRLIFLNSDFLVDEQTIVQFLRKMTQ